MSTGFTPQLTDLGVLNESPRDARRKRGVVQTFIRQYQLWLMVFPAIAVILIFNYIPMYGAQLAFRQFNFAKGLTGGKWEGLRYFIMFFNSFEFWTLIRNTLTISAATILIGFPAPIFLALLFNQVRSGRVRRVLQTTVYLPHFISMVVMVGLMVVLLAPNTGIIGSLLSAAGLGNISLLGNTATFVPLFVGSAIWQDAGWGSIIYLAALSSIDPSLYDACVMDGANRWQVIWHVDIPGLIPTIVILFVLSMGNILNTGFEKIFLMQNQLNLPVSSVIATYVYKIGLLSNQYSFSAAIGVFNNIINFIFLISMNAVSKRMAGISLW